MLKIIVNLIVNLNVNLIVNLIVGLIVNLSVDQEFRREGWTEKRSAVCFCLGSGLFGSYNSD